MPQLGTAALAPNRQVQPWIANLKLTVTWKMLSWLAEELCSETVPNRHHLHFPRPAIAIESVSQACIILSRVEPWPLHWPHRARNQWRKSLVTRMSCATLPRRMHHESGTAPDLEHHLQELRVRQ